MIFVKEGRKQENFYSLPNILQSKPSVCAKMNRQTHLKVQGLKSLIVQRLEH